MFRSHSLALVICWLLVLGVLLRGIWEIPIRDLAAFLGAMWIWCAVVVGSAWYETFVAHRPFSSGDVERLREAERARMRQLYWPAMVGIAFLPGVWIGVVAQSPFLMLAIYWMALLALRLLNRVVPPRLPRSPFPKRFFPVLLLRSVVMLLGGTAVGIGLRIMYFG